MQFQPYIYHFSPVEIANNLNENKRMNERSNLFEQTVSSNRNAMWPFTAVPF